MALFRLRKNKSYSYTPRHYKGEGNPFEMKHKFEEYRSTVEDNKGLKSKFKSALRDYKSNVDKAANRRILIIIAILILLFLFIIDFDLSIFFPKK